MTKKDYIKFVGVWKKSIRFMGDAREKGYHYIDADSSYNQCVKFSEKIIPDLMSKGSEMQ